MDKYTMSVYVRTHKLFCIKLTQASKHIRQASLIYSSPDLILQAGGGGGGGGGQQINGVIPKQELTFFDT